MAQLGKIYLIPTTLGETENPFDVLPQKIKRSIELLDYYIVENEKTARKFIGFNSLFSPSIFII